MKFIKIENGKEDLIPRKTDRYSEPVIAFYKGGPCCLIAWDFVYEGWVHNNLNRGAKPSDYEEYDLNDYDKFYIEDPEEVLKTLNMV